MTGAERQRAWRKRKARREVIYPVTLDKASVRDLVALGRLRDTEAADPKYVAKELGAVIREYVGLMQRNSNRVTI